MSSRWNCFDPPVSGHCGGRYPSTALNSIVIVPSLMPEYGPSLKVISQPSASR